MFRRFLIWAIALICSIAETHYFGNNMLPSCDAEMICDLICAAMCCMAFL